MASKSVPKVTRVAAVQSEPVWGDLDAGVKKTVEIIQDAASKGVKLLVFPELWIPGSNLANCILQYPFWIWTRAPVLWGPSWTKFIDNSVLVNSSQMDEIRYACSVNKIWILLGFAERVGSSLWMSTCWINEVGEVIGHRRKILPTGPERCLFGTSSGDSVQNVVDTPFGRAGSLQCWEHVQPLLKYHTASQHEQIHAASWPCLFPLSPSKAEHWGMTAEGAWVATKAHAMEAGCYAILSNCIMTREGGKSMGLSDEELDSYFLQTPGGGAARIFGPDGRTLAGDDLPADQEGLVICDIDLLQVTIAKTLMDCVGHYSRPDILRLQVSSGHHHVVSRHSHGAEPSSPAIASYNKMFSKPPPTPVSKVDADDTTGGVIAGEGDESLGSSFDAI